MDEVEYCIVRKNKKLAADEIKKLSRGTISTDVSYRFGLVHAYKCKCAFEYMLSSQEVKPGCHEGVVERPMKSTENAVSLFSYALHAY